MSITLYLITLPYLVIAVTASSSEYNYAVQINPVIFLTHPLSNVQYETQALSLSCQANISQVVNKDVALPSVNWRYNGSIIRSNNRLRINTNTTSGFSNLYFTSLSVSDAGLYECVADDADGRYVTLSDPAIVTVIPLNGKAIHYLIIIIIPFYFNFSSSSQCFCKQ